MSKNDEWSEPVNVSKLVKQVRTANHRLELGNITLLSTVVAPSFSAGSLVVEPVENEDLGELLHQVDRNLCGHPVTNQVLRGICPTLPESKKEFWEGNTEGLAVRPKGGVRNAAQEGDTQVTLNDLEAALVRWVPAE